MNSGCADRSILDTRVDATSYPEATARILGWARAGQSRYVCACNVHMVMEAHDRPDFRAVVNGADLVTPDGMPLVWALRRLGLPGQTRVYGPDLTLEVCRQAAAAGLPIGLYGSTPATLTALQASLRRQFPDLKIAYACAPPFGQPTPADDVATTQAINDSGTRILMVGLGCPKQERWVAAHRGRVAAVMLAVGAAFDFHAGTVKQAPRWMQAAGLEWVYRLFREPGRLGKRYLKHNPRFALLFLRQLLTRR